MKPSILPERALVDVLRTRDERRLVAAGESHARMRSAVPRLIVAIQGAISGITYGDAVNLVIHPSVAYSLRQHVRMIDVTDEAIAKHVTIAKAVHAARTGGSR